MGKITVTLENPLAIQKKTKRLEITDQFALIRSQENNIAVLTRRVRILEKANVALKAKLNHLQLQNKKVSKFLNKKKKHDDDGYARSGCTCMTCRRYRAERNARRRAQDQVRRMTERERNPYADGGDIDGRWEEIRGR